MSGDYQCPNCGSFETEEISPLPGLVWYECLHCSEAFTHKEVQRNGKKKRIRKKLPMIVERVHLAEDPLTDVV